MNCETGNVLLLVGCVTVLLLVGGPGFSEAGFKIGSYCRALCAHGRGGNLCKCSAVHFAGKRDHDDNAVLPAMLGEPEAGFDMYDNAGDGKQNPEPSSKSDIRNQYIQREVLSRLRGGGDSALAE